MFRKKIVAEPVKVETTSDIVNKTISRLSDDIVSLSGLRDDALSHFRSTAVQLATINDKLTDKISVIEELEKVCAEEKTNAQKLVSDNEAVRKKILDIIGE